MSEGRLEHKEASPTAASVGNRLYGVSGVIPYRVTVQSAMGAMTFVDVDAATGDGAAEAALANHMGAKVLHVEPAPRPTKKAA